ncbi:MAG: purine-nucleoside phosphorylase [Bacteroidales bacterium]|nr:purine-nucleoside phosphorylase [Bacteroidales bacterium]
MDTRVKKIREAAAFILEQTGGKKPEAGIILGSGLGKLADAIAAEAVIPYAKIPNFQRSTAIGHKGNLIFGRLAGKYVCAMQGRFHYYEGYTMEQVTLPVRVMAALGVKALFVSNAAGGLNQRYSIGDLMIIRDHINMMPNPLIGKNFAEFGERFPDMTAAYDSGLIAKAETIAKKLKIKVQKGVYLGNTGPSYETPAEVRYYLAIGADAVGMSTVPEVLVARHCGIPVFGMSVITNVSNTENDSAVLNDGDDVVRAADAAADKMCTLFTKLLEEL